MDLPVTASSLPTSNYASTNIGTRGAILAKVSLSPSKSRIATSSR